MFRRIISTLIIWPIIVSITAAPVLAQEANPGQATYFTPLLPAALTLLLPLGLILLMSSAMPEEKAPATVINLLVVWSIAALAYFGLGFAFHFGGIAQVSSQPDLRGLYWEWYPLDQSVEVEVARLWGVIALQGWGLAGEAATPGAFVLFLSHVSLVGTTALIPASVLIQQDRKIAALFMGLFSGTLIYPVAGNWLWGGGWVSHLGSNLGLGHGLVDLGGASVIFLTGSGAALMALFMVRRNGAKSSQSDLQAELVVAPSLGGHLTVYDEPPKSSEETLPQYTPMPSAYLPILSVLGGGLTLLGWFGLTSGAHIPTAVDFAPGQAAVAGLLAALAGALAAAGYSWFTTSVLNPLMTARGLVAGLIVATAGAPFAPVWVFVAAGLLVGLGLPPLIYLFDRRLPLADAFGTLTTYGVSAMTSLVLVALLADGQAGQGWNGVGLTEYRGTTGQGVSGLIVASGFQPDWPNQLQAQLLGAGVILLWALLVSFLLLKTINVVNEAWSRSGLEWIAPASSLDDSSEESEFEGESAAATHSHSQTLS